MDISAGNQKPFAKIVLRIKTLRNFVIVVVQEAQMWFFIQVPKLILI